jgi:hypothetical protein
VLAVPVVEAPEADPVAPAKAAVNGGSALSIYLYVRTGEPLWFYLTRAVAVAIGNGRAGNLWAANGIGTIANAV